MSITDLWLLVIGAVTDALNLDWSGLSYNRSSLVIKAAVLIAAVFFAGLASRWYRSSGRRRKAGSQYFTALVPDRRHEPNIVYKLVRGFAWCLGMVSICFLGIALADPVVFITNATELIESREIIYIKDVSASNGFHLPHSDVTRGELTKETLDKLILKRKDRMDRAAYVVFATESDIWSGFTTSSESLIFSVSMSPVALAPPEAPTMWPGIFVMKKGQYVPSGSGYGTNLHLGLESAIYLFDKKGSPEVTEKIKQNPNIKMRSVVILTDGAAEVDPEPQFKELRKRHIIPYLVFIDPDRTIEKQLYGEDNIRAKLPDQLLVMVRSYGGQYFLAKDRESVDRISESLDKLQSVKQTKKASIQEKEVYFIPLAISFLFAVAAIAVRVLSLLMWRIV